MARQHTFAQYNSYYIDNIVNEVAATLDGDAPPGETERRWPPRLRTLIIVGASLALWAAIALPLLWLIG